MRGPIWPALWLALALVGCAGSLGDPLPFYIAADAGPPPGPPCDAPMQVFIPNCTTAHCHSQPRPASNLDLSADAGLTFINALASTCAGQVLVDPGHPHTSYLFTLVTGTDPACDTPQMPLGTPPLSAADIACVSSWITNFVADAGAASAGPGDAGPEDGGTGDGGKGDGGHSLEDAGNRDAGAR